MNALLRTVIVLLCGAFGAVAFGKPTLLYSRYFNAKGETRYLPDKDYSIVLERLSREFEVRVSTEAPTEKSLDNIDTILISNPSAEAVDGNPPPPRFSAEMISMLTTFVSNGGGLILMGNQENHNLEVDSTNQLLSNFGMKFVDDYTDIKAITFPEGDMLLSGLKWGYYSGNAIQLIADPLVALNNDAKVPLLKGERNGKGALLAYTIAGKGRVAVVTDAGWITNVVLDDPGIAGIRIEGHHNYEIFRRLVFWSATAMLPLVQSNRVFANRPVHISSAPAGEGPAWDSELGLLTSHGGNIHQYKDGKSRVFRADARTNGLLFDANRELLCCEPGRKRVTRLARDGTVTVLTDSFEGKAYNTPNDITFDAKGRIYFSDPRYGKRDGMELLDDKGVAIEGVYRIDPDGKVTRIITHEVDRPNGVLVSNDQRHLFVADNNNDTVGGAHKLWRFDLREDGTVDVASQKLLFDWFSSRGPDGLVQAKSGTLYVAAGRTRPVPQFESSSPLPGGVYAFTTEGELLGFVPITSDEVTNCTIGGEHQKSLYVTSGGELWTVPLP
jgi:gluconolactonase